MHHSDMHQGACLAMQNRQEITGTRLERTMLFVPASRPDMIARAAVSAADAVCIDLEDAVVPEQKAAARTNVARAFAELDFGPRLRIFRINGLDTGFAYRDLVEVVEAAGDRIDLVMLPKAGSPADVAFVATMLAQIELATGRTHQIGIEAQIETATGFLNLREIARASDRLEALIFGPGDYAASMRMPLASIGESDEHDAAYPGHRWHAVMHSIVAAARANSLRCMDGPFAAFKDLEGLERAARTARAMGFDGKQCIHPSQLDAVNRIFTPPPNEIAWARRVLGAYEEARSKGQGVVTVDGRMVDAANIRMASVLVKQDELIRARVDQWRGATG
jgi:citrate lyase subunit beta/citryl-CoA lyase